VIHCTFTHIFSCIKRLEGTYPALDFVLQIFVSPKFIAVNDPKLLPAFAVHGDFWSFTNMNITLHDFLQYTEIHIHSFIHSVIHIHSFVQLVSFIQIFKVLHVCGVVSHHAAGNQQRVCQRRCIARFCRGRNVLHFQVLPGRNVDTREHFSGRN